MKVVLSSVIVLVILISQSYSTLIPNEIENESFTESLSIKIFDDDTINFFFNFTFQWNVDLNDENLFKNYNLFPKSIGKLIDDYDLLELDLSFTQGRWDHRRWDYAIHPAPTGVEFRAWFYPDVEIGAVPRLWKGLTNGVGGLFCASLVFLDDTMTATPDYAFLSKGDVSSPYMKYGVLPREAVCTENITPWLKMLPCSSKYGLASILSKPRFLYDSNYQSMGVHLKTICRNKLCNEISLVLELSLDVVKEAVVGETVKGFKLDSLFYVDNPLFACPLSKESKINVQKSPKFKIQSSFAGKDTGDVTIFDLWENPKDAFSLALTTDNFDVDYGSLSDHDPVKIIRFIKGYGHQSGEVVISIKNDHSEDKVISVYQLSPWFIRYQFHTTSTTLNNEKTLLSDSLLNYVFSPAEERSSPSTIEFIAVIPGNSIFTFSVQFDKAFLHWREYPPDAHKGFDIGPAIMNIYEGQINSKTDSDIISAFISGSKRVLYSEGLYVELATPDFSMPYNVIIFTCTTATLFFGSIVTTLTIRHSEIHLEGTRDFISTRPIPSLIRAVMKIVDRVTMKF